MKLTSRTLSILSEMICGQSGSGTSYSWKNFPYRSSSHLTRFFRNCEIDSIHDGSVRDSWVFGVVQRLNDEPASVASLPPDSLMRVICEILDTAYFENTQLDRFAALQDLNSAIGRDNLEAYIDGSGRCQLRSLNSQANSAMSNWQNHRLTWSKEELDRRQKLTDFLENCSEDELIEDLLQRLFSLLGFRRISVSGHKDKALEFGKDLWMKYQLPTSHFLYFGIQAKRGRLDSAGKSNANVAEILNQILMMLKHPIWDPETNKKNLLDHVFIVCGGEITKQAKDWLGQHLDSDSRRQIMFMDREDILNLAIGVNLALPEKDNSNDNIPF